MPMDPIPQNYHVLATQMFAHEVACWTAQLAAERNASRRFWLQRQIERAQKYVDWHHHRASSGAAVPDDVAELAETAWRLRVSAHKAASTAESQKRWGKFRLVMRAAGHALKEHLRSVQSAGRSMMDQPHREELSGAPQG